MTASPPRTEPTRADSGTDPVISSALESALPAPGPKGLALVRTLCAIPNAQLATLAACVARYGDVVSLPAGRLSYMLLTDPDHVAHVLIANGRAYRKSPNYTELELILGKGLLTSEGELWKRQRRIAQPTFNKRSVARFVPLVTRLTGELLGEWRRRGPGAELDAAEDLTRLTLQVVGHALFSKDLSAEADKLGGALRTALPIVQRRTEVLFNLPSWLPLPSNLRLRRAVRELDRLVGDLVAERRAERKDVDAGADGVDPSAGPVQGGDFLSLLIRAQDPETGERMSDRQVRDEVMTFLLAGHETTANALAWTFYLLGQHPEVEVRLRAEAREVLGGRPPALEDLPRLEVARRVALESMRLYPPAWMMERQALEDDAVGGYRIPRGTTLLLSPYLVQRRADLWEDPLRFDPDRFAPERARGRHRCAYFPFGAGQRQCIGEALAMAELQLILSMIVQETSLELVPGHPVEPEAGITLRPKHGLRVRLRPVANGGAS